MKNVRMTSEGLMYIVYPMLKGALEILKKSFKEHQASGFKKIYNEVSRRARIDLNTWYLISTDIRAGANHWWLHHRLVH